MTDVETIAKSLTKAQTVAVQKCWADGNEIVQGGIDDSGIDTRVITSLYNKRLLAWKAPPSLFEKACWHLNDIGLAVRAHLSESQS